MDHFAGLDVSVKETSVCIVDDTGRIVREVKVASEPDAPLSVLTNPGYLWIARQRLPGVQPGAPIRTEGETGTELAQSALAEFRALGDASGAYRSLAQLIRLYESRPDVPDEAREA